MTSTGKRIPHGDPTAIGDVFSEPSRHALDLMARGSILMQHGHIPPIDIIVRRSSKLLLDHVPGAELRLHFVVAAVLDSGWRKFAAMNSYQLPIDIEAETVLGAACKKACGRPLR